MAKNTKTFNYNVSGARSASSIKSMTFFDGNYSEPEQSPIDLFQQKKTSNMKLLGANLLNAESGDYIPLATTLSQEWRQLANLVVLGLVSSVESYFRCLIRRLLNIDEHSRKHSYSSMLTYGAALHHQKILLPEALLENASFTSSANIVKSLNSFIDINLGGYAKIPTLLSVFTDYDIICHLRHCVVHRAGLLGSNNALALGFDEYSELLEKPLAINFSTVQEIAVVCDNLVKEVNDKLFADILARTVKEFGWKGDLRSDKIFFKKYFDLFSNGSVNNAEKMKECYRLFISAHDIKV
ncbi:TPA: hypothetical protein ACNIDP_005184 [Klebsiella michiganensis]|uniref:hypothetical protein n=1 Tax=Klebsiella michiganensis TaxID=1134687 RepID=UPI0022453FC4|nr:hypothetical protein [Klebsiella michiganensis]MCW9488208.1 hypothetical protein [Klebsiella michiganensis]